MNDAPTMKLRRRDLLLRALFGPGLVGLRSLATGIPAAILADPRRVWADPPLPGAAQYVLLNTSAEGDPITCNVPGTYGNDAIAHPTQPQMAPTTISLRGTPYTAAQPWSTLPQALLDRTCFFHHATYSVVHADQQKVQTLGGYTTDNEMFISMLAGQLAPALGTVQSEPIALGPRNVSESVVYRTQPQPIYTPSALALLLGPPTGPLGQLTALRDRDLDRLNALVRCEGTPAQAAFIDQYAHSQAQVRQVSETLLSVLQGIHDDGVASQLLAAVTLFRMNVAPAVTVHIPFGGDNHADFGFMKETQETVSGMASLASLWSTLNAVSMQDRVSFLSLNVFGRTMSRAKTMAGRAHNANHHCAIFFGAPFRGSVVGGIEPVGLDIGAMSIDPVSGRGVPGGGGSIGLTDSFQSMALTFGRGAGVDPAYLRANISGGVQVNTPLVTP